MNENQSSSMKQILSFLIAREALIFAMKFNFHLLRSIVRLYCAKLSFLCLLPLKRLAIAPPTSIQVRVLLNELYPDQGPVVSAASCRSSESLCIDDYLVYLQKFGFDDPEDGQIDELNLLFQANHLPISVFQPGAQNHDRETATSPAPTPTTSTCAAAANCGLEENSLPSGLLTSARTEIEEILPTAQQTLSSPELDFKTEPSDDTFPDLPSPCVQLEESPESSDNSSNPSGCSSHCCDSISLPSGESVGRTPPIHGVEVCDHIQPIFIPRNTSSDPRVPVFVGPLTNATSLARNTLAPSHSALQHRPLSSIGESVQPRQRLNSNPPQRDSSSAEAGGFVWPRYDKPRRLYAPYPQGSSSSDDLGHSSDSEFFHRSLRLSHHRHHWNRDGVKREDFDLSDFEDRADEDEESDFKSSSTLRMPPSTSHGSASRSPQLSDRNIRDVNILKRLSVPFSYEEVAYSSNEQFREMKAKPGLTLDQINAMLDARRRATNRQAAERCRRVKSAARDSLANQLSLLRVEHADLARRIISTRKRRQRKWDELTSAQKCLLQNLVDSSGNPLDPSQWRIQTTGDGELILVRIEVTGTGNGSTNFCDKTETVKSS